MTIIIRGLSLAAAVLSCGSYLSAQIPENFLSVTPCRIADTRTSSGGAGPIAAGTYRKFTIGGKCGIPVSASAFSLNVTAVPPGTLTFLSVLPAPSTTSSSPPSSSTLNDPLGTIVANAAIVPSGVNAAVTVYVSNSSDVILDTNGYFVDQTLQPLDGTALGTGSLSQNSGQYNTGTGFETLSFPSGSYNTANGAFALTANTTGRDNTGVGYNALAQNSTGFQNVAVGSGAMSFNTDGFQSTAVGFQALNIGYGSQNTAFGNNTLASVTSGGGNVALGYLAGYNITTGSNNIEISNYGSNSDANTILIGTQGTQTSAYIAGIYGSNISGSSVVVNSSGRLGVALSSIRFKEDVHDMAEGSDALMQLRPVEFRYKQPDTDGTKPLQFGLIAEEVAKVYPELVVRGKDGQIDSVQYQQLPAMLLNEAQKQHRTIQELQASKAEQAQRINNLEAELEKLRALLVSK